MVTKQDVRHLKTFGFKVFRGLLSEDIAGISTEFDRVMGSDVSRDDDGRVVRTLKWQAIDSSPALAALIDDDRIVGIFDALLGTDWQYFGSVGNYYAGDTGWHTDDFSFHDKVKVAIYLDETGPGNGGLSVIPGSHVPTEAVVDLQLDVGTSVETFGLAQRDVPCTTLTTQPGDVIAFHHNIMHSSWGGGSRRRMLSINGHARYSDEQSALLVKNVIRMARFQHRHAYGKYMVAPDIPTGRRVHLQQCLAHETELSEAVDWLLEQGEAKARDVLPDMSRNSDRGAAANEFARDTDYAMTVAMLRAASAQS